MSDIKFSDIWQTLSTIDCREHTKKKDVGRGVRRTYLSWTWAWGITMKHFPNATYSVREWDGRPYMIDPNVGAIVMTTVDIGGNVRPMWMAVMDGANNALKAELYTVKCKGANGTTYDKHVAAVDMCAINKAIMRCLVKNLAMFGLGLNIYAGEDLPVGDAGDEAEHSSAIGTSPQDKARDDARAPREEGDDARAPQDKAGITQKAANPAPTGRVNVKRINCTAKAKEAWTAFKARPASNGLTEKQLADEWRRFVSQVIGSEFTSSAAVTDAQWEAVLNQISVEEAM